MRILFLTTAILLAAVASTHAIMCKGGKVKCSDSQTCCPARVAAGVACCPYENATCCADKLHCCPQDTTCDSAHARCVPKRDSVPWATIGDFSTLEEDDETGNELDNEISNRACPGGTQSCPDTYTCCAMATGGYGCCPMDGAVCCADKIHCCPSGTQCDTTGGRCVM